MTSTRVTAAELHQVLGGWNGDLYGGSDEQLDAMYRRLAAAGPDALAALNRQTFLERIITVYHTTPFVHNVWHTAVHTAVHMAAKRDAAVPILRLHVDAGADPDAFDDPADPTWTPLMLAVQNSERATRVLVEEMHVDVDKRNKNGETALHYCASQYQGIPACMEILLQNGADPNLSLQSGFHRAVAGSTPLHLAGIASRVSLLLQFQADTALTDANGYTAMHEAAEQLLDEKIQLLLDNEAERLLSNGEEDLDDTVVSLVEIRNSNGNTPLDVLADTYLRSKDDEDRDWSHPVFVIAADAMLQHYHRVVIKKKRKLSLHWLLQHAEYENSNGQTTVALSLGKLTIEKMVTLLTLLVTEDPSLLTTTDATGALPLHVACRRSRTALEVIQFLVGQAPETVRSRDRAANLPLHALCSAKPSVDVVAFLYRSYEGAIQQTTHQGFLPITVAALFDASKDVLFCLLSHNSEAQTIDNLNRFFLDRQIQDET